MMVSASQRADEMGVKNIFGISSINTVLKKLTRLFEPIGSVKV